MSNLIGKSLGRYNILEHLGEGGITTLAIFLIAGGVKKAHDNCRELIG